MFMTEQCKSKRIICTLWFIFNLQRRKLGLVFCIYHKYTVISIIYSFSLQFYLCIAIEPTWHMGCVADADAMCSILVSCSQSTDTTTPIPTSGGCRKSWLPHCIMLRIFHRWFLEKLPATVCRKIFWLPACMMQQEGKTIYSKML